MTWSMWVLFSWGRHSRESDTKRAPIEVFLTICHLDSAYDRFFDKWRSTEKWGERRVDENIQKDLVKGLPAGDSNLSVCLVTAEQSKINKWMNKNLWARARDRTGDLAQSMLGWTLSANHTTRPPGQMYERVGSFCQHVSKGSLLQLFDSMNA